MSSYQSLVERVLDPVGISGSNVLYRCPKCEGSTGSGHLYVDYSKGYFNCVKCGEFGGKDIRHLLKYIGVDYKYDYESLESSYNDMLNDVLSLSSPKSKIITIDYSRDLNLVTNYFNFHTIPLSNQAMNYLYSRGIFNDIINFFGIREGLNRYGSTLNYKDVTINGRDYSGRIMIPSIVGNNVSFFVGRDYTNTKPNRYVNPPQEIAYSSEDVWSLDMIKSDSVVICEGVITALSVNIAVGYPIAVATYGKSISDRSNSDSEDYIITSQGEKLLNKRFSTYYVFYDRDARKEAFNSMKYLYDRGAKVKFVYIDTDKYGPKADAANLTRDEIFYYLNTAKDFNEFLSIDL